VIPAEALFANIAAGASGDVFNAAVAIHHVGVCPSYMISGRLLRDSEQGESDRWGAGGGRGEFRPRRYWWRESTNLTFDTRLSLQTD